MPKIKPCGYDVSDLVNIFEYFHRKVWLQIVFFFFASWLHRILQVKLVACVSYGDHLSIL